MKRVFLFDLDGTLTTRETLPLIAVHFGLEREIAALTRRTVAGEVSFVESLEYRVGLLGRYPIEAVSKLLETTPLHEAVCGFIAAHRMACAIATSNLGPWVGRLAARVGCALFASQARVAGGRVTGIASVLAKESLVERFQRQGHEVVFIGDGHNDLAAMRMADVSIAAGLTHRPAPRVLAEADHVVWSDTSLVSLLRQLARA